MNKITTVALPEATVSVIGIDLDKNVFALHGINGTKGVCAQWHYLKLGGRAGLVIVL